MSTLSNGDDDMDEAVRKVCISSHDDDINQHDASKELLRVVADKGDAAQRQEAVEIVAQHTDYNKSTAKDWIDEVESAVTQGYIDVHEVVQIVPHDSNEPHEWEFHVTARGEDVAFRVDTTELMGPTAIQQKVFEATRVKVKFEDWDEILNEWLEQADVVERDAEPIELEHQVARDVIKNIGRATVTDDYDAFKRGEASVLLDDDEDEVLAHSKLINTAMSASNQDVKRRRLRSILDPCMAGNAKSVRSDDGFVSAWRFDVEALDETDAVDIDKMRQNVEGSE